MRLAVREDGPADAPPLVLLNSIGSTSDMWTPCLVPLAERFRVLRLDTRGHGDSPPAPGAATTLADLAGDVIDTLDAIGADRVALAGLSLGGMVGQYLAIHHPNRISRLVLLCTSARTTDRTPWDERAATVRAGGMNTIADAVVGRWITPALADRDPALVTRLRDMVATADPESYARCCEAIAELDLVADLGRIAAPTLVVAAAGDPALPPPHQQVIADGVPGSRLEVVPDAAHVPTYEQPARVAQLLLSHFDSAGTQVRRAVLGDAHVDAAVAATSELTAPFQDFITRYAWGEVWTRPGLDRQQRSIATLAALTSLGAEHELRLHVRGALRNGLSAQQIVEVLHHTAVYAGVPRANRAIAVARTVLEEDA